MVFYAKDGSILLDVAVDDNSYRYREIMGDNTLTLYFSLAEHVEIPVGAYVNYQSEQYTLQRPEALKMNHTRDFEYTVTLESEQAKAKIWKFRNPVDGRLKFSLTAKPIEHLQMFVDNMNLRDSGWAVGDCVDAVETLVSYDHAYCWDALGQMADTFNTEFQIVGKQVSLCKVEYNKTNPLPLSYGRGNGFKSGVGRTNYGDTPPIEILYPQGGSDNIDYSKYGASELHLPKSGTIFYDGTHFEDEEGFDEGNARQYVADEQGLSVRRLDKDLSSLAEDSLDCSAIYPKRVGTITEVVVVSAERYEYDIIDDTIPDSLNYEDCLIEGEQMSIIFQDKQLAGKEFEVKYIHKAKNGKKGYRFEIVPQDIDGQTMPNKDFPPEVGGTYAVFHCMLPQAYINAHLTDTDPKTGAEWDMMRQAVIYLYDNEEKKFTFSGELDGLWAKKDWENIGGRIILGGFVLFTDDRFQKEGISVRIIGIKDYINNPHSPEIELSNNTVTASFKTQLATLESQEVQIGDYHRDAIQFTKRRFRDARETMAMLDSALLDNFTNSITPLSVQTMMMLVGDESLQFQFVESPTSGTVINPNIKYNQTAKQLSCPDSYIQHLTLGIKSVSSQHATEEYKFWYITAYTSAILDEPEAKYYLYAVCGETSGGTQNIGTATYLLSETARPLSKDGEYNLLIGVLNSEYNGERSFVTLYGFTEVLPGRVTTDRIVSGDEQSFFDLVSNALKLGDKLQYNVSGDGLLKLKGTLVQSQSGEESYIGCYRGVYKPSSIYYQGDEVSYTIEDCISTYRYTFDSPTSGHNPNDTTYWQVIAKGSKGKMGESPAMVYRGIYDASKTYYGNANRLDCVKSGDAYYIARIDAGEFDGIAPPDATKWNTFGASFESVATQLLLADEANLAGWIYRNERMESQATDDFGNPMVYLDGKNGEMRLRGTIQHSTGTSGAYSDVDLFSLPATTTAKFIKMGYRKDDIGKRCLLTNLSEEGSMGYYSITSNRFGWTADKPNVTYSEAVAYHLIEPGATVEMTCFQLPSGSSVSGHEVSKGGVWLITNRFNKEIAPVVAMGYVTNVKDYGAVIQASSIAGNDFSVSRSGTGQEDGLYTITMPEFFDGLNEPLIMLTGRGYSQDSSSAPVKATLISQSGRTFVVCTSDNASMRAGSFNFVVYSLGGWTYPYSEL